MEEDKIRKYCLRKMELLVRECHGNMHQHPDKEARDVFSWKEKILLSHIVITMVLKPKLRAKKWDFKKFEKYYGGYVYDECMHIFKHRKEMYEKYKREKRLD